MEICTPWKPRHVAPQRVAQNELLRTWQLKSLEDCRELNTWESRPPSNNKKVIPRQGMQISPLPTSPSGVADGQMDRTNGRTGRAGWTDGLRH